VRVVLLPGMGCDARLHAGIADLVPEVVSAAWPDHRGCTGLSDYAERVIARLRLTADDVVGGSSMGGMVAAEIHRGLGCRGLVLIGSCDDPRFIQPRLRRLTWVGERAPFAALSRVLAPLSRFSLLLDMLRRSDPEFLRWACGALGRWSGARARPGAAWRIHGTRDPLILARGQAVDRLVPRAGHVLALSHPRLVAAFIRRGPWRTASRA
jgi:pimeloyl-ACP methyl ester carboxylesterase